MTSGQEGQWAILPFVTFENLCLNIIMAFGSQNSNLLSNVIFYRTEGGNFVLALARLSSVDTTISF